MSKCVGQQCGGISAAVSREPPRLSSLSPCLLPTALSFAQLCSSNQQGQWLELEENSGWNYDTFVWWWCFVCVCLGFFN